MRVIEVNTQTNQFGNLELNYPLKSVNQSVRVIILVEEENEEKLWMKSVSSNATFDFLKGEEDIYSINDGKPIE